MITMIYDFKLKPTKSQIQQFEVYLETCRKVYNYALRERKDWVNSRKSPINACSIHSEYIISPETQRPTYNSQCKSLTDAKKLYQELTNVSHSKNIKAQNHYIKRVSRITEKSLKKGLTIDGRLAILVNARLRDKRLRRALNLEKFIVWKLTATRPLLFRGNYTP